MRPVLAFELIVGNWEQQTDSATFSPINQVETDQIRRQLLFWPFGEKVKVSRQQQPTSAW